MRRTILFLGSAVALTLFIMGGCREENALVRYEDPRPGVVRFAGASSSAQAIPYGVRHAPARQRTLASRRVRSRSVPAVYRATSSYRGGVSSMPSRANLSSPAEVSVEAGDAAVQRAEILLLSDVDLDSVPSAPPLPGDHVTSRLVKTAPTPRRVTSAVPDTKTRVAAVSPTATPRPGDLSEVLSRPSTRTRTVTRPASIGPEMEPGAGSIMVPGALSSGRTAEVTISYAGQEKPVAPELEVDYPEVGLVDVQWVDNKWVDVKWVESHHRRRLIDRMAY